MTSHTLPSITRLLLVALSMQLLAACTSGDRMRRDLAALEARNQSDSLLTDSTLALSLADYFTTHGTQAERLEAHYLLARTWADFGQAPRALDAFHTAAEQADTTRLDSASCHFLSRIYGQMGGLLYNYDLPRNALEAFMKGEEYAYKANEKIIAFNMHYQQSNCYFQLNIQDSVIYTTEKAYKDCLEIGDTLSANTCLGPLAYDYILRGDTARAKRYLDLYQYHSLLSDELIMQNEEWKLLYYYRAYYFLETGQRDSALYYFNLTNKISRTINNKALAYQGLYKAFAFMHQPDSTQKYAILYAEANDSTNRLSTSSSLLSMHHLYDYSRFQTLADRKTIEASRANQRAVLLAIVIAVLVSLFFFVRKRAVKKLKKVNTDYVNTLILYNKVKDELQSQQNNNAKELQQAESELQRLKEQLATAQQDKHTPDKWDMNSELLNSYIYLEFHQAAAKGKTMPTEKWEQLRRLINSKMPRFMEVISTLDYSPDLFETQLILLIKLRFLISEIAVLLDVPTYTLTKRRKRLLKLMFKTDDTADEFDRRISVLGIDETVAF